MDNIYKFEELEKIKNIQLLKQIDLEEMIGCRVRKLYRRSINDFIGVENYLSDLKNV